MPDTPTDPTSSFRLDDRVVLVTGASSGLGARFAAVAAGAGATVVLAARRIERLSALVAELDQRHGSGRARAVEVDLTAPGGPERCVADALDVLGRVDVLINNAGISQVTPAVAMSTEDFRHEI